MFLFIFFYLKIFLKNYFLNVQFSVYWWCWHSLHFLLVLWIAWYLLSIVCFIIFKISANLLYILKLDFLIFKYAVKNIIIHLSILFILRWPVLCFPGGKICVYVYLYTYIYTLYLNIKILNLKWYCKNMWLGRILKLFPKWWATHYKSSILKKIINIEILV